MAKVNPGELRELITICETIKTKDKGITSYKYEEITKLKAKVKHDKTNLFYDSETRKKSQSLVFITHKRDFVNEDNFVLYKNQYYRIIDVIPFEDRLYCQIIAEVVI